MSAKERAAKVLAEHFAGKDPRTHAASCSCGWEGVSRLGDHMGTRRDITAHLAEALDEVGLLIDSEMSSVDACLFADWREVAKHHWHLAEAYKARLARVEALADEWDRESPAWRDPVGGPVTELRAALREVTA